MGAHNPKMATRVLMHIDESQSSSFGGVNHLVVLLLDYFLLLFILWKSLKCCVGIAGGLLIPEPLTR